MYSATLSHKKLLLRLLSYYILPFRLSCICYTAFRLSRYYCVASLAVYISFYAFIIALV